MIPIWCWNFLRCSLFVCQKGKNMQEKHTCSNCKWCENLPFADEYVCGNADSDYSDCPSDYPDKDTCDKWERKNG